MIGKIRYAASEIAAHGTDSHWWRQRLASRVAGPILGKVHGNTGIDFMAEDWDNLLLLDACRADLFEDATDVSRFDEYRRVHSPGCSSPEWMRETFDGQRYPDTVYVTANPWISKVAPDSFHHIENLWIEAADRADSGTTDAGRPESSNGVTIHPDPPSGSVANHWNDVNSGITIHPDTLSDAARRIHEEYPDKRLIVHYFQPHAPVVGNPDGTPKEEIRDEVHPGDDLRAGNVSYEEVWEGYKDNLLYALHYAETMAKDVGGRTVLTADHGELFGERLWPFPMRAYAHPDGLRHPKLTEVPWAVAEHGDRRRIVAEDTTHHEADDEEIDERLRDLGYKV